MSVAIAFLFLLISLIFLFIPPFHWSIILFQIFLISLTCFLILKKITQSKKYSSLIAIFILIILIVSALKVLDVVNFILILSLFFSILILIK